MRFELRDRVVGWGDDVLQLFDAAQTNEIGRHRQTEALLRGEDDVDLRLVMDECALVLDDASLADPVRECARQVLLAVGVDPNGPIRRSDAGTPMIKRLQRVDLRNRAVSRTTQRARYVADGTRLAASEGFDRAQVWLRGRRRPPSVG